MQRSHSWRVYCTSDSFALKCSLTLGITAPYRSRLIPWRAILLRQSRLTLSDHRASEALVPVRRNVCFQHAHRSLLYGALPTTSPANASTPGAPPPPPRHLSSAPAPTAASAPPPPQATPTLQEGRNGLRCAYVKCGQMMRVCKGLLQEGRIVGDVLM